MKIGPTLDKFVAGGFPIELITKAINEYLKYPLRDPDNAVINPPYHARTWITLWWVNCINDLSLWVGYEECSWRTYVAGAGRIVIADPTSEIQHFRRRQEGDPPRRRPVRNDQYYRGMGNNGE